MNMAASEDESQVVSTMSLTEGISPWLSLNNIGEKQNRGPDDYIQFPLNQTTAADTWSVCDFF